MGIGQFLLKRIIIIDLDNIASFHGSNIDISDWYLEYWDEHFNNLSKFQNYMIFEFELVAAFILI